MFYDNFVRLCNSVNKSPSAVATEIGLSRASVNGWKNGKKPTDATIIKIADYFSVPVEDLLGNEIEPATDSDRFRLEDDIDLTDVDIAFLGGFKELTEENQATIRDMVRIMRERQKE